MLSTIAVKDLVCACKDVTVHLSNGQDEILRETVRKLKSHLNEFLSEQVKDPFNHRNENHSATLEHIQLNLTSLLKNDMKAWDRAKVKSMVIQLLEQLHRLRSLEDNHLKSFKTHSEINLFFQVGERIKKSSVSRNPSMDELYQCFERLYGITGGSLVQLCRDPIHGIWYEVDSLSNPLSDGTVVRLIPSQHAEQSVDTSNHGTSSRNPVQDLSKVQKLTDLRSTLSSMRKEWIQSTREFNEAIHQTRSELTAKTRKHHERTTDGQSSNVALMSNGTSARRPLEAVKDEIIKENESLQSRLNTLVDVSEQWKNDLIHHSALIAPQLILDARDDVEILRREWHTVQGKSEDVASGWKKVWEMELNRVVQEQAAMKSLRADIEKTMAQTESVAQSLEHLSTLSTLKAVVPSEPVTARLPPPTNDHKDFHRGLTTVMQELVVATDLPDHDKRVDALNRLERVRQWELKKRQNRPSEFGAELGMVARKRNVVDAVEQLEHVQQQKQAQVFQQWFTTSR